MRDSFFHCNVVSNIITCARFVELRCCLHLRRLENIRRGEPRYDELHQTRRLVDQIRGRCQMAWCIREHLTNDEMMIRYRALTLLSANICQISRKSEG